MLQIMSQGENHHLLRLDPRVRSRRACRAHSRVVQGVINVLACNTTLCKVPLWRIEMQQDLDDWCDKNAFDAPAA